VDLWAFATDRNNSNAIDFYANHMDIIKQFILYMHEQARHILFPKDREITIKTDNHFECEHTENTDKNQILFEFSKYYYGKEQGQYLTRSQFLCVYLLSCGNSMKEIANKLTISSRTVECHLNAVKQKLGETCRSKLLERAKYLINMHK
jgi:ATP/maltotriose-dependent transcriptional regulator MalT